MDDKLCSFSAYKSLINVSSDQVFLEKSRDIALVALFDNEEIGSSLRQGAKGNFLESVLRRVAEIFSVPTNSLRNSGATATKVSTHLSISSFSFSS